MTSSGQDQRSPLLGAQKSLYDFVAFEEDSKWTYDNFKSLTFNILTLKTINAQFQLTIKILMTKQVIDKFNVSMSKFSEFWKDLRGKYEKRQNYFHNFEHGINGKTRKKSIYFLLIVNYL